MGHTVIADGAATFVRAPHFVPRESVFPAVLSEEGRRRIGDISLSCLRALNLGWGPANIELRWTKRGPVVIEVNPRLPGWTAPCLIELAYGVDLIKEHIKLAIGDKFDQRAKHLKTAAAWFLVPDHDGIFDHNEGAALAAAAPGVVEARFYIEPGTPIVQKGDYRDMIGHIIAASSSHAQTGAILQRAIELMAWRVTPFPILAV
jgi:biotin carboxylase